MASQLPVERRRDPKCSLCVNHLGNANAPRTLGHKNKCPYGKCPCEKCKVTLSRRKGTAVEQQQRRNPDRNVMRPLNQSRRHPIPVENIIESVKDKLESIINKCYMINGANANETIVTNELLGLLNTVEHQLDVDLTQMQRYQNPPAMMQTQGYDSNQNYLDVPTTVSSHPSPNGSDSSGYLSNSPPTTYETLQTLNPVNNYTYCTYTMNQNSI